MSYTKLFGSILDSSIWMAPDPVRILWITMLAMKDQFGVVEASVPGLARRAVLDVEATRAALAVLLAPDPDSRTKAHDGRRIAEIDGGWRVLNHELYLFKQDPEEIRQKNADRQARFRDRKRQENLSLAEDVTASNASNALSREVTQLDQIRSDQRSIRTADAGPVEVDGIPDRAFGASDYLRSMLLKKQPNHALARKPWDPEKKMGLRAKWAREFDLLVRVDGRSWADVANTIRWLFEGQTGGYEFVVQAPKSLREKWDRIQLARARSSGNVQPAASQAAPSMRPRRDTNPGDAPALPAVARVVKS